MQINIGMIRINVITNVGSFNVGKTILCNNRSTVTVQPGPEDAGGGTGAEGTAEPGGPQHEPMQRSDNAP
ncbi:Putative uncharacterized protein [Thermobacillus xylanilyticus]|jgi:hypothetical protein|uniref:Spore germination protein n=1 Tax=Thermobacillus xylanilyticus TaxID=76633 RepID=A0ABM8V5K7_THEXY|nr:hypothetical protein [Thermobacillus xylanilyticus]REJ17708.1 MAG: hypothetical protein C6W59_06625 [Paenibacillaceae bacterium]CAG5088794.1 Putative uncharacterized protein [Thermobacillus xylanilyticus]